MRLINLKIKINPFSEIAFHPDIFETRIDRLEGSRLTVSLKAGANSGFLKTGVCGRLELQEARRSFRITDIKEQDGRTILACRVQKPRALRAANGTHRIKE